MIALWMAVVGVMLLAISYAFTIPAHIRQDTEVSADQVAMQVYSYGASINDYINKTPGFTEGVAPPFCTSGAPCLTPQLGIAETTSGDWKPLGWNAYIDKPNGQPRIILYSNADIQPDVLAALSRHGGGSLFIGKSLNNGQLFSAYGNSMYAKAGDTPQPLTPILNPLPNTDPSNPNHIADKATVVVWRQ